MIRAAIAARSSFNLIHLRSYDKIDVFISKGRPQDKTRMERRLAFNLLDMIYLRVWADQLGLAGLHYRAIREAQAQLG